MEDIFNNKPFFALQFEAQNCAYDFRINDATVFYDADGGPIDLTYPGNSYINNTGKNTYSMILFPMVDGKELAEKGQKCKVKLSLLAQTYQTISNYTALSSIEFIGNPEYLNKDASVGGSTVAGKYFDGLVEVGATQINKVETYFGPGVEISQTVTTPKLNMPHWTWLNGEKIANSEQTRHELFEKYQEIWQQIHNHQFDEMSKELRFRNREVAQALYQPVSNYNIVASIKKAVMQEGYVQLPLNYKHAYLKVMGNGRLARLFTNLDDGLLIFNRKEQPKSQIYDLEFSKINGEWVVTN